MASDHRPAPSDVCTDLEGNPEVCPDAAPTTQHSVRNKQKPKTLGSEKQAEDAGGKPDTDVCRDLDGHPEACPDSVEQQSAGKAPETGGQGQANARPLPRRQPTADQQALDGRTQKSQGGKQRSEVRSPAQPIKSPADVAIPGSPHVSASDVCTDPDGRPEACPTQGQQSTTGHREMSDPAPKAELGHDKQEVRSPDQRITPSADAPMPERPHVAATDTCTDLDNQPETCPPQSQQPKAEKKTLAGTRGLPVGTENREVRTAFSNFVGDQKWFWTSPFRMRENDLSWFLPFTMGAITLAASDTAIEKHLPQSKTTIDRSSTFSDAAVGAFAGIGAGAYFLGRLRSDDQLRQTGLLSAEAAADSLVATEVIKTITGRDRPLEGDGRGHWFQGGASFPSEHAAAAWSIATVMAGQYPGWMTKLLAYGGAAAVSATRVTARQHFASDALIGSALGWYVGHHVLNRDADSRSQFSVSRFGTFDKAPIESSTGGPGGGFGAGPVSAGRASRAEGRQPGNMGSPYVPLDSWVYPAFDRLIALGYVQSAFASLRPWTRLECARLLAEAQDLTPELAPSSGEGGPRQEGKKGKLETEVRRLYGALNQEFARERALIGRGGGNVSAQVESVYTRFTGISGSPLTDGYNFGQTLFNDYGRPYQEGVNNVTGVSSYATAGPLAVYVTGEYQHAPSGPALSSSTRTAIAAADTLPVADIPGGPFPATNRFRLQDSYVALNVRNWQFSFGKQSLWWGPDRGSAFQFSNNAEPVWMLRLSRVSPFQLPGIFRLLGPVRSESLLGQLQGHHFILLGPAGPQENLIGSLGSTVNPQPYIWGEKINFHPTPNLEFGVSAVAIFAGYGRPLTLDTFFHTFSLQGNSQSIDPGKRSGGFDFTYRIPGLRKWLALYANSMSWDEINPIGYPRRSAMNPGIYIPQIPLLPKLDLRAEGIYTDLPGLLDTGFYYYNSHYLGGYTNYGQLMGSWVGREGRGMQFSSTYWLAPQRTFQLYFRKEGVNPDFLGGGTIYDLGGQANFAVGQFTLTPKVQFERWRFPLLASGPQLNTTVSLQLTYRPDWKLKR